ncbi:stage II sporulation protein M [Georgenia sp. Z1344]|uniref:stage II sporulation protein M n=1 Tax=Georgenia sp. Z1344 TaxID=3416706 RepID=UPI003CF93811
MDAEALGAVRSGRWERLDDLAGRRTLTGQEADELVRLYQATSADLSRVRTRSADAYVTGRLSDMLARARGRITGTHEISWRAVRDLFLVTMPLALWRVRWWTHGVTVAFLLVAFAAGWYFATTPGALAELGSTAQLESYADEQFAAYYSNYPSHDFAAQVWTNNAWIAAQTIGLGITGVWPVQVLALNAVSIGQSGAVMAVHGDLSVFFSLLAPHGLLELTAIFVAGGAGLKLFWTMLVPGGRRRQTALAVEGRTTITVAGALVVVLLVSGLVEGYVTGTTALDWWVKIVIGAIVWVAFWVWTLWAGGRAHRAQLTADLADDDAGYRVAEAG